MLACIATITPVNIVTLWESVHSCLQTPTLTCKQEIWNIEEIRTQYILPWCPFWILMRPLLPCLVISIKCRAGKFYTQPLILCVLDKSYLLRPSETMFSTWFGSILSWPNFSISDDINKLLGNFSNVARLASQ